MDVHAKSGRTDQETTKRDGKMKDRVFPILNFRKYPKYGLFWAVFF